MNYKIKIIPLALMILWDASLHWVELLGYVDQHPLYPYFPLFSDWLTYDIFWTTFWTLGFIISIWILFGRKNNARK